MFDLLRSFWSQLEMRDRVAFGALVIAATSVMVSISSRRLASRAYRLSLETHRRSQPSLELYLIDGRMRPVVENQRRVCLLKLRISNQSDSPNGIRELKLRVDCRRSEQPATNFFVQHDSSYSAGTDGDVLQVPQGLSPRSTVSGLGAFPIPEQLISGAYVDAHTVILTDNHSRQTEYEVLFLREVRDANREAL